MATRKLMWFDNPPKRKRAGSKRRKTGRRPPGRWKSWKAYMAHIRGLKKGGTRMAKRKRRRSSAKRRTTRRSHRRSSSRRIAVVRHPVLVNPRRRRHVRRYRRMSNPRFSVGGIMGRIKSGAIDGLYIVGGKAVTNAIPALIGLSPTGALGLGVKALSAVAAGYVFGFVSPNAAKLATAAGFAAIYEPFIKGLGIPLISNALAADDDYASYPTVGAYPDEVSSGNMSAWPDTMGENDYAQQY